PCPSCLFCGRDGLLSISRPPPHACPPPPSAAGSMQMQHHASRQLRDARGRVARTPAVSPKKPAQVPAIAATFPNPRRCSRRLPSASKPPAHRSHLAAKAVGWDFCVHFKEIPTHIQFNLPEVRAAMLL
ncbi:unnamed protein product, partial [Urochloa humidicola]